MKKIITLVILLPMIAHASTQYEPELPLTTVKGNDATGYSYSRLWYDQIYIHNLECATERFQADGAEKLTLLAIKIDNAK